MSKNFAVLIVIVKRGGAGAIIAADITTLQ